MALLDARALYAHAREIASPVAAFPVVDLVTLHGVVEGAGRCGAPVVVSLPPLGDPFHEALTAAAEVVAERATAAVVLHQPAITTVEEAALALNRGVTSLGCVPGLSGEVATAVAEAAGACGVAVLGEGEVPGPDGTVGVKGDPVWLLGPRWEGASLEAVSAQVEGLLRDLAPWGRWESVLDREDLLRRPVDHVILFNVAGLEEGEVEAMLEEGARVLGKIPGVRDLAAGVALKEDAAYRYHWMVRFVHPGVVPFYRDHPDHVAFADGRFRPVAGNRVSIDYLHRARARGGRPLGGGG